jgi:opacity protein-like surface antigen
MDLSLDKMKDENYDSEYKWTSFLIGPFVRYYITDLDGFMPYAEAGLGIGSGNNKTTYSGNESDEKYNMFGYKFGAGGTYFVTKNVGVDLFIGYKLEQETYKNEDTGERSDVVTYKCGGLSLNIGFIISLGK